MVSIDNFKFANNSILKCVLDKENSIFIKRIGRNAFSYRHI